LGEKELSAVSQERKNPKVKMQCAKRKMQKIRKDGGMAHPIEKVLTQSL
jgi:hypothetical protein